MSSRRCLAPHAPADPPRGRLRHLAAHAAATATATATHATATVAVAVAVAAARGKLPPTRDAPEERQPAVGVRAVQCAAIHRRLQARAMRRVPTG